MRLNTEPQVWGAKMRRCKECFLGESPCFPLVGMVYLRRWLLSDLSLTGLCAFIVEGASHTVLYCTVYDNVSDTGAVYIKPGRCLILE